MKLMEQPVLSRTKPQTYKTVVKSIINLTHDIKEINLELISPKEISFLAGQIMSFSVMPDSQGAKTSRTYSISSTPADSGTLQFIVKHVPGGKVSGYIHQKLKQGDEIELKGPFGNLYVRDDGRDMICIAGGSGMSSIKSIVTDLLQKNEKKRQIWFFFGGQTQKDIFYTEYFGKFEKQFGNFHFIPCIADKNDVSCKCERGLVTEIAHKFIEEKIELPQELSAYLCGSRGLLEAAVKMLVSSGISEKNIFYDMFNL
jgi:Na+-transporting NADH:ubiquinone oxidoreductase subunit F